MRNEILKCDKDYRCNMKTKDTGKWGFTTIGQLFGPLDIISRVDMC